MSRLSLSRRTFLGGAAATTLLLGSGIRAQAQSPLTIGMIYVGPKGDFGWNQAHAVGAAALKALPDVTVVEEENVPETDAVSQSMESMINLDGARLLFPTSFGYFDPFMVEAANKYPDVQFRHPTSLWNADNHPTNLGGYLPSRSGPLRQRDRCGPFDHVQQDRLHRRQADCAGASKRQRLHSGGQEGQSGSRGPADHHWRMELAGA